MIDTNSFNDRKKSLQVGFGTIFLFLNCFALISNLWSHYYDSVEFQEFFFDPSIFLLLICIPLFVISILVIKNWTRMLLVVLIFIYGLIGISDNVEAMWGWSLVFISVLLSSEFELTFIKFEKIQISMEIFFIVICSIWVICFSFLFSEKFSSITSIFGGGVFFLLFSYLFLFRHKENQKMIFFLKTENRDLRALVIKLQQKIDELTLTGKPSSIKEKLEYLKHPKFSPKEKSILRVFLESSGSITNKEIAYKLLFTESSVNTTMHRCMMKLEVKTRTELFVKLIKLV